MSAKIVLFVCLAMVLVVCFMSNLASAGEELGVSGGAGNGSQKDTSKRLKGMRKVRLGALNVDGGEGSAKLQGLQTQKQEAEDDDDEEAPGTSSSSAIDLGDLVDKASGIVDKASGIVDKASEFVGGITSGLGDIISLASGSARSGRPQNLSRQIAERLYKKYVPEGSQRSCGAAQQAKAAAAPAEEETASSDGNKDAMSKLVQMLVQLQSNGKGGKAKSLSFQG